MDNQKKYYTIKVEAMVPAEVKYKVLAENPQQALEMIERPDGAKFIQAPVKYILSRLKKFSARAYDYGTLNLQITKKW